PFAVSVQDLTETANGRRPQSGTPTSREGCRSRSSLDDSTRQPSRDEVGAALRVAVYLSDRNLRAIAQAPLDRRPGVPRASGACHGDRTVRNRERSPPGRHPPSSANTFLVVGALLDRLLRRLSLLARDDVGGVPVRPVVFWGRPLVVAVVF